MLKVRSKNSMPRALPKNAVADALNNTTMDAPRSADKTNFAIHVSSVIQTKGPHQFCARYHVLSYHGDKRKPGGKITPGRRLLFATGAWLGEYVVEQFMRNSPYGQYVYAKWSCEDYTENKASPEYGKHTHVLDTYVNVTQKAPICECGKVRRKHNEIDLVFPKYLLTGHPDIVVRLGDQPSNYKFYIYEVKSVDRADIAFDDITIVFADHRLQVTFYYKIMRALGMRVSNKLRVLYVDRSNRKLFGGFPIKEIETTPEHDDFLQGFINNLLLVIQGLKSGRLPSRICKHVACERAKNCELAIECFSRRAHYVGKESHRRGR